jgi:peroxiredoxin Q/BCP
MLLPGALAPDFDVEAHDGSRVRLSDYAGRYVLLWFYPEADTPG